MKKCSRCKEIKNDKEYFKNRKNKDGLQKKCKICLMYLQKESRKNNQKKNLSAVDTPKTKICSKCKIEKESIEFHKATIRKDGLDYHCKDCSSKRGRQFTLDNGFCRTTKLFNESISHKIKHNNACWINSLVSQSKFLGYPTEFICAMDDCSNQAIHYHHLKYDSRNTEDPISIITPLCRDCHDLFHIREREGIDLTDKILTLIELEYIKGSKPNIKFLKERL